MKINLRLLYLYLFSFVGLLIVVFGSISMVNLGLKAFVFKDADVYETYPVMNEKGIAVNNPEEDKARQMRDVTRQRQRELAQSISMILVGLPLYLYHWKTIQKEKEII